MPFVWNLLEFLSKKAIICGLFRNGISWPMGWNSCVNELIIENKGCLTCREANRRSQVTDWQRIGFSPVCFNIWAFNWTQRGHFWSTKSQFNEYLQVVGLTETPFTRWPSTPIGSFTTVCQFVSFQSLFVIGFEVTPFQSKM